MENNESLTDKSAIKTAENPLETCSIGKLILKYSLPAILSSLVSSIYNIVDQIFVGNSVGLQGNAATNVAFPLVMVATAIAMIFGVGGASVFSLYQGRKENEKAKIVAANSLTLMIIFGIVITVIAQGCLPQLLYLFGGRDETLEYALEYTRITTFGILFAALGTGATQLIRANGSPKYAMFATLSGAVLNCILDPIFIFCCKMGASGMSGAAYATLIGQIVTGIMVFIYFFRRKNFGESMRNYLPKKQYVFHIFRLGLAAGANQLAIMVMQIVMNNTLGKYGDLPAHGSGIIYGRDITIGSVGIITKASTIFNSVIFGIAQSTQPIIGYNYGAGNYKRAKKTFFTALIIVVSIAIVAEILFMTIPKQITSIFGNGETYDELYFEFSARYFRIFLSCLFLAACQILCTNFFPSIGKGVLGMVVSLSRQCILLLPLVLIFPLFWGIDGVLYAGPIADGLSGLISLLLVFLEMRKWKEQEKPSSEEPDSEVTSASDDADAQTNDENSEEPDSEVTSASDDAGAQTNDENSEEQSRV